MCSMDTRANNEGGNIEDGIRNFEVKQRFEEAG